jgi:hypothetical protein
MAALYVGRPDGVAPLRQPVHRHALEVPAEPPAGQPVTSTDGPRQLCLAEHVTIDGSIGNWVLRQQSASVGS